MSKKNRPTDSGGNWMDTYGDMVTLLLTFFIMLYSMSNLDAQKWTIFVKSIPNIQNQGSENITINSQMSDTPEVDSKGQEIGQEDLQAEDVNKLYLTIAESLNQAGVKEATVIRGDDYTYVSFANNVFFGANSSVLTREGQAVLYTFAKAIAPAAGGIEQVPVFSSRICARCPASLLNISSVFALVEKIVTSVFPFSYSSRIVSFPSLSGSRESSSFPFFSLIFVSR